MHYVRLLLSGIHFSVLISSTLLATSNSHSTLQSHNPSIYLSRVDAWSQETNSSITENLQGKCKWILMQGDEMPPDDTQNSCMIFVSTHAPTAAQFFSFYNLPNSLTTANKETEAIANKTFYVWANTDKSRWEIPLFAPGQNRSNCFRVTTLAANDIIDVYQPYKKVHSVLYVMRKRQALIDPTGSVSFGCGYFQGAEGAETRHCGTKKWHDKFLAALADQKVDWNDLWPPKGTVAAEEEALSRHRRAMALTYNSSISSDAYNNSQPVHHQRVFVIAAAWDHNYHHFIADNLVRLVGHLKFLRDNTDVKIHMRRTEKKGLLQMHAAMFNLLGISTDRLISGSVLAAEIFLPRYMHAAVAVHNPLEIRRLAKILLKASGRRTQQMTQSVAITDPGPQMRRGAANSLRVVIRPVEKKNLIVLQRYNSYTTDRFWGNSTYDIVVAAFIKLFPEHNVVRISSLAASQPNYCLACEIMQYAKADILVGMHGAGLSNAMFMPAGSLVVEMTGRIDAVNMPVCGYIGVFGAIFGHHHYLYTYATEQGDVLDESRSSEISILVHAFYSQLRMKRVVEAGVDSIL